MIRRISRNEARVLSRRMRDMEACRRDEKDDKDEKHVCDLPVKDQVDLAVGILEEFDVTEIEYEEGEEPNENEAICEDHPDDPDEESSQVGVTVDMDAKKLIIDLDEKEDIEIDLDRPEEEVVAELKEDLTSKLEEQEKEEEEAKECNRRFEAWKRNRRLSKEGKRISRRDR